jgi:UDP-N-acetylmuramyl tripeptide synthase
MRHSKVHQVRLQSLVLLVVGATVWKRPVLGKIADEYCDEIIITNEDPYDEDPQKIIDEVAQWCYIDMLLSRIL